MGLRLSVTICTFNEEEFIATMLDSMIDHIYELIILDGCSKDKTIAIIEGYQAAFNDKIKLYFWEQKHPRSYIFDEKGRRDWTFEKAKGEWILFTAPDEIFPDYFWEDLDKIMDDPTVDFYTFPRINLWKVPTHWRADSFPDPQLRMFRNGMGEFSEGEQHGFLVAKDGQHGGEGARHKYLAKYPIYHFHWCSKLRSFDPFWRPPEAVVKELEIPLPTAVQNSSWLKNGGWPQEWL